MAFIQPFSPILETTVLELIGEDEQIEQNELGAAVEYDGFPGTEPASGELLSFMFLSTGGDVLEATGQLLIFDADPGHSAGDDGSGVSAAEWQALIGIVDVAATDWVAEDNGAVAFIYDVPVPFHSVDSLFFVFRYTLATTFNSAAGDNEVLSVNVWYQRHS